MARTAATNSGGSARSPTSPRNVTCASAFEATCRARNSVPSARATPVTRPSRVRMLVTGLLTRISAPCACAARASACVIPPLPPHPAPHVPPHPPHPVALAHDVVKQHIRRSRHRRRRHGADDRVGGEGDLELLRLEPAVEDRPRGPREDLERPGPVGTQLEEAPPELRQRREVARPPRPRVGRG